MYGLEDILMSFTAFICVVVAVVVALYWLAEWINNGGKE